MLVIVNIIDKISLCAKVKFILSIIVVIVVGVQIIVGMVVEPSVREQHHAERSKYLFIEGRDDLTAVKRGLSRLNESERAACITP